MKKQIAALTAGILFGLGLSLAQMIDPARVLGFLNLAGAWDPTLALVMVGALLVNIPATRIILKQPQPLFDGHFHLPKKQGFDWQLLAGAALFGIGWGLAGYCPGPALTSLSFADGAVVVLVISYLIGSAITRWLLTATAASKQPA
ncbi:MAG: DUF6691 family protein [Motiliproteus sp.]